MKTRVVVLRDRHVRPGPQDDGVRILKEAVDMDDRFLVLSKNAFDTGGVLPRHRGKGRHGFKKTLVVGGYDW
jgi:hypothetical protein